MPNWWGVRFKPELKGAMHEAFSNYQPHVRFTPMLQKTIFRVDEVEKRLNLEDDCFPELASPTIPLEEDEIKELFHPPVFGPEEPTYFGPEEPPDFRLPAWVKKARADDQKWWDAKERERLGIKESKATVDEHVP